MFLSLCTLNKPRKKTLGKTPRKGNRDFMKDGDGVMGHSSTAGQVHNDDPGNIQRGRERERRGEEIRDYRNGKSRKKRSLGIKGNIKRR